jgi:hypothetical protein
MSHDGAGTGVRSLQCIKNRCHVDDITGCWLWSGAMTKDRLPKTHIKAGAPLQQKCGRTMGTARAAWLLAGKTLEPGHVVYRAVCHNLRCCNPAHLAAGTPKAAAMSASMHGQFRDPEWLMRLAKNRRSTAPEVVQAVLADIEAGMTCVAASKKHGIGVETAKLIRRGEQIHQRAPVLSGASVFAWRP